MIALEIPPWIAARQVRAQFVDLSADTLDWALRHYAPEKGVPVDEKGLPPPNPKEIALEAPKSTLPAYLTRFSKDRGTRAGFRPPAPLQDAQRSLF